MLVIANFVFYLAAGRKCQNRFQVVLWLRLGLVFSFFGWGLIVTAATHFIIKWHLMAFRGCSSAGRGWYSSGQPTADTLQNFMMCKWQMKGDNRRGWPFRSVSFRFVWYWNQTIKYNVILYARKRSVSTFLAAKSRNTARMGMWKQVVKDKQQQQQQLENASHYPRAADFSSVVLYDCDRPAKALSQFPIAVRKCCFNFCLWYGACYVRVWGTLKPHTFRFYYCCRNISLPSKCCVGVQQDGWRPALFLAVAIDDVASSTTDGR